MSVTCSQRALRRHADRLLHLARALDEATADDTDGAVVRLVCSETETELGVLPLEGAHPLDLLFGFEAPPDWAAVGVTAAGEARVVGTTDGAERVRLTCLAHRSGASVAIVRRAGAAAVVHGPLEGLVPDSCKRAVGVDTTPPPATTGALWGLAWLDVILEAAGDSHHRHVLSSFAGLARLHPAWQPGLSDAELDRRAAAFTRERPWSRLRVEPWLLPSRALRGLSDATARWMDEGMLSRWSLGAFPDAAPLVHDVRGLLSDAVGARVADVFEAGFDPSSR